MKDTITNKFEGIKVLTKKTKGEMTISVDDVKVKVIFQRSGDIDYYKEDEVYSADECRFEDVSDFICEGQYKKKKYINY